MRRVPVALGARAYDVVVGVGVLREAGRVLAGRDRVAIVSQPAVLGHWEGRLREGLHENGVCAEVFPIRDGEDAKVLATVEDLCRRFATWGLRRGDAVVALGGGVVGDVVGLTAALYHRGVAYVQAPTTLLAQVDAAIGGKTGVNLPEGKNLVGSFHQPLAVLADVDTLATLPEREYRCGLGEVVKYACVLDEQVANLLSTRAPDVLARDAEVLEELVARCAAVKAAVVAADEYERSGVRARLNYGHTLAHALETVLGYRISHGEAVAVGVVFAAHLAREMGRIDADQVGRHRALVEAVGLPASVPEELRALLTPAAVLTQMGRDKKSSGGLTFVLPGPEGLGPVDDPPASALARALAAVGIEG